MIEISNSAHSSILKENSLSPSKSSVRHQAQRYTDIISSLYRKFANSINHIL